MFKVNNGNTRTRCQICSKLTIKIPERRQCFYCFSVSIVNLEHVIADGLLSIFVIFQEQLFIKVHFFIFYVNKKKQRVCLEPKQE